MARFHRVIDVNTGIETQEPYTPEEEAAADAAVAAEQAKEPENYKAMIRRRANELFASGDVAGALLLLKDQLGE